MKKRDLHWLIYLVILLGIPLAVRPTGSLTQLGVYALSMPWPSRFPPCTPGSPSAASKPRFYIWC